MSRALASDYDRAECLARLFRGLDAFPPSLAPPLYHRPSSREQDEIDGPIIENIELCNSPSVLGLYHAIRVP